MASLPDELYFKHPERKGLTDNVFHRRVGGSSNVPTTAILCSDEEQETEDLDELLRRSVEVRLLVLLGLESGIGADPPLPLFLPKVERAVLHGSRVDEFDADLPHR